MNRIRLLPEVHLELRDTLIYYESIKASLGYDFLAAYEDAIIRILENPSAWAAMSSRVRRCQLHRFPYGVFYIDPAAQAVDVAPDEILVIAVMHMHRDPELWKSRE